MLAYNKQLRGGKKGELYTLFKKIKFWVSGQKTDQGSYEVYKFDNVSHNNDRDKYFTVGDLVMLRLNNEDWDNLKDHLGILPYGLNRIEVQVLRHLSEKKDCSLTHLAAKTGLSKSCLQRDFEMYLQKMNLMEITTAGRCITAKGQEILAEIGEPAE